MKKIICIDDDLDEVSFLTDCYLFSCIDETGDIVVHCDCLDYDALAKIYFALSDYLSNRLDK